MIEFKTEILIEEINLPMTVTIGFEIKEDEWQFLFMKGDRAVITEFSALPEYAQKQITEKVVEYVLKLATRFQKKKRQRKVKLS